MARETPTTKARAIMATKEASTALHSRADAALDQTGKEDSKSFINVKLRSVELDCLRRSSRPGAAAIKAPQAGLKRGRVAR
jgi:hypothetical protein